ncbi:MAG TPA: hypothetical protein VFH78_11970 [Candidatus Thermoplasmatota archaeon]|nr:hypothetical protein [Candidatus Thermoplasmatota archaeon]
MRGRTILWTLLALTLVLPVAAACLGTAATSADACAGDVTDLAGMGYVVVMPNEPGHVYVYLESNGEPGLQRGGCGNPLLRSPPDVCQESANPDILLF